MSDEPTYTRINFDTAPLENTPDTSSWTWRAPADGVYTFPEYTNDGVDLTLVAWYNYDLGDYVYFSGLPMSDEQALSLLQPGPARSLYQLNRAEGMSIRDAMMDVLKLCVAPTSPP